MELMDISIDFLYKRVYSVKKSRLNENIIGHITVCVSSFENQICMVIVWEFLDCRRFGLPQKKTQQNSSRCETIKHSDQCSW